MNYFNNTTLCVSASASSKEISFIAFVFTCIKKKELKEAFQLLKNAYPTQNFALFPHLVFSMTETAIYIADESDVKNPIAMILFKNRNNG